MRKLLWIRFPEEVEPMLSLSYRDPVLIAGPFDKA